MFDRQYGVYCDGGCSYNGTQEAQGYASCLLETRMASSESSSPWMPTWASGLPSQLRYTNALQSGTTGIR